VKIIEIEHIYDQSRLTQKQNEFADAFTMVHHTSNCYMQTGP